MSEYQKGWNAAREHAHETVAGLQRELSELLDALVEMVGQNCEYSNGKYNDEGLSAHETALDLLVTHGRMVQEGSGYRFIEQEVE